MRALRVSGRLSIFQKYLAAKCLHDCPPYPKLNRSHIVCWYQDLLRTQMTPTAVSKTCRCYRVSMLRTVDTQTVKGGDYHAITGKRFGVFFWSVSAVLSLPSHSSLHCTPLLEGFSTPLVMTMLQTALLNLGALPELRCNSGQKKKNMTQASARGREWSFSEKIDNVWSSAAPRHTPALLRLRHPAGEGADVAGKGCGGLRQKKTLQKNCPSQQVIHVFCSLKPI